MNPHHDDGGDWYPCGCNHGSDGATVVDALITLVASLVTIVVVLLRHPFYLLLAALWILFIGAVFGWW